MDSRRELSDAIELLADIVEAFTAALFIKQPGADGLRAVAWHSLSKSFRHDETIKSGEGLVGYAAKHGQIIDVDRHRVNSDATGIYADDEDIKALLVMPVSDFGVLAVDIKNRPVFGEREKKTVRDFAKFFANMMLHHDVCCREAMYGRILDLLYEVENASLTLGETREFYRSVLDAGRRYTGLPMGLLCLLHPGRRQFTVEAVDGPSLSTLRGRSFPVSQGLIGLVMRKANPLCHNKLKPLKGKSYLVSPDEQIRGYNAFLGVPLISWKRLIGVWAFAGSTERVVDEEELRALQLAGHRVAATMEHCGLCQGVGPTQGGLS